MAEEQEVKQEIQEEKEAPKGLKAKLLSPPVLAVAGAVGLLVLAAVFMLSGSDKSEAQVKDAVGRQDPEVWKENADRWRLWPLDTIWVTNHMNKGQGAGKLSGKFSLKLSREFLEGLEKEQEALLKSQVRDLIQSVLDSRSVEIKNDPKRARQLLQEDVLRGLKMGANPNDPKAKTYHFPFNVENLDEVFVEELEVSRW